MARTIESDGYVVKRPNMYMMDPRGIRVDWAKNLARNGEPFDVDDPEFQEFARSMLPIEMGGQGQISPICTRPTSDNHVEVYLGFRRLRAALWLQETGQCLDYLVSYVVNDLSPEEAALRNIVENLQRLDPKPIQLASALRTLRDSYGLKESEIAKKMHRSCAWVNKTIVLLRLPEDVRESIAEGETTAEAGREILTVPEEERAAVFEEAKRTRGGKKVNKEAVQDTVRAKGKTNGELPKPPRTIKHLKVFLTDRSQGSTKDGRKLATAILKYLEGQLDEAKLQQLWDRDWAPTPKD